MTVLALSPHLDDAAFSAGATLATLAARGHAVVVATVFTQSVPAPTGFALRCQTDKGIAPEADYMALRRAEDAEACRRLGAEPVHLGLPEAPHRGYDTPEALFAGVHSADAGAWRDVLAALRSLATAHTHGLVLTCQGLGGHADHLHVAHAAAAFGAETGVPVLWWRDAPYALREPDAAPAAHVPRGLTEIAIRAGGAALAAKLDACAAYETQIAYQFGRDADTAPEAALRERLGAFAQAEARRLGVLGAAEAFHTATPDALARVLAHS